MFNSGVTNANSGTGTFYKYLTVSGQSIVRYSNDYTYSWNSVPGPGPEPGG